MQDSARATPVDQRQDGPGVSHIDPSDPAAPMYQLLDHLRHPMTLRALMIEPVRSGYIGDHKIDPKILPPSAEALYPQILVSEQMVPSAAGPVRCQVYSPPGQAAARPMCLYMHGGGFTVGRSEDTAYITSRIAAENGTVVVSVNYRLAPEWPFPAGLDDCLAVLLWMQKHGTMIGGDPARIVLAGDSSGANFAAVLPLKARDEGHAVPQATILLAPVTDFHFEEYESFERLAPLGIVYDMAFAGYMRGACAVTRRNWDHPHVSPARADLHGYPPTLIVSGTADPLTDDNRAFANKLRLAGCDVNLLVRERMPHGFYFFPQVLSDGELAFAAIQALMKRQFHTQAD
ncbi:alpha/beta hydrolase [Pseudorhodoplanes sinuspersici]|uniref:Alpha/beta hydrolase n=1 Tax=Pseudorhodoplanes sinuspersici TaxID=1235591 RepID=A0A1W6ZXW3_9HYPH|nr:alpha/beta hydrolase [Pseudorhodoplanes sinuspersici]ARQ02156.1 alpha/beta hydrolase [Pseudorhodoplanes sinuspersici]RKE73965.1 acetyl esterase [Pseudorhodoplanes sinuspersici]